MPSLFASIARHSQHAIVPSSNPEGSMALARRTWGMLRRLYWLRLRGKLWTHLREWLRAEKTELTFRLDLGWKPKRCPGAVGQYQHKLAGPTVVSSHEVIVNLIVNATTLKGLTIQAELDTDRYPTGIKVTEQELKNVKLKKAAFHGEWNYTITPTKPSK